MWVLKFSEETEEDGRARWEDGEIVPQSLPALRRRVQGMRHENETRMLGDRGIDRASWLSDGIDAAGGSAKTAGRYAVEHGHACVA